MTQFMQQQNITQEIIIKKILCIKINLYQYALIYFIIYKYIHRIYICFSTIQHFYHDIKFLVKYFILSVIKDKFELNKYKCLQLLSLLLQNIIQIILNSSIFISFSLQKISTRKLSYYEQKLLKHSNLYNWDTDRNDQAIQSKYGITKHQQLVQYRQTARKVRDFVENLTNLPKDDPIRLQLTEKLSQFLYQYNLTDSPSLSLQQLKNFSADRLMKRRVVFMLKEMKFAPTIEAACNFVKTGQISIGANVITNINYHLKPGEEDYLGWTQGSTMQKKVDMYNQRIQ